MKFGNSTRVYVYQKPIDMRWSFERLSFLVREQMGFNLDIGDLFLFLGNNRRRLKGLRFDGSGLVLFIKRMEKRKGFMSVEDLEGRVEISEDELLGLRKKLFGKSSEKRKNTDRLRDKAKKRLSVHAESLVPPPSEKDLQKLDEIRVDHELSLKELSDIAEEYGYPRDSEWECLKGFYDESEELDIRVESYVRKRHRRFKYRLKRTKGSDSEVIVTAPAPLRIRPGSRYSIDFSLDVVMKKYLYHLPLERTIRMMELGGLKVATKTLYGLCFFVHCYLEDMAKRIKDEILNCGLSVH